MANEQLQALIRGAVKEYGVKNTVEALADACDSANKRTLDTYGTEALSWYSQKLREVATQGPQY